MVRSCTCLITALWALPYPLPDHPRALPRLAPCRIFPMHLASLLEHPTSALCRPSLGTPALNQGIASMPRGQGCSKGPLAGRCHTGWTNLTDLLIDRKRCWRQTWCGTVIVINPMLGQWKPEQCIGSSTAVTLLTFCVTCSCSQIRLSCA